MTEEARRRLGQQVIQRRRALGLSAAQAARLAGLNPKTWEALEKGTRSTRDSNYAGIEQALRWRPGSIDRVLNGGYPWLERDADPDYAEMFTDPATGEMYQAEHEQEIWLLTGLTMEERRHVIYQVRALRARKEAEQRRTAT